MTGGGDMYGVVKEWMARKGAWYLVYWSLTSAGSLGLSVVHRGSWRDPGRGAWAVARGHMCVTRCASSL